MNKSRSRNKKSKLTQRLRGNTTSNISNKKKESLIGDLQKTNNQNAMLMNSIIQEQMEKSAHKSKVDQRKSGITNRSNQRKLTSPHLNNAHQNDDEVVNQPIPDVFFIHQRKKKIKEKKFQISPNQFMEKQDFYAVLFALKKILKSEIKKHQKEIVKNEQFKKNIELLNQKIKTLKDKEVRLRQLPRLEDRKVATLKFNLKELDEKLNSIDKALNDVLTQNDMVKFVQETNSKNQELDKKVSENLAFSSDLKNSMALISQALMKLNSQQINLKFILKHSKFFCKLQIHAKNEQHSKSKQRCQRRFLFYRRGELGYQIEPQISFGFEFGFHRIRRCFTFPRQDQILLSQLIYVHNLALFRLSAFLERNLIFCQIFD